MRPLEAWYRRYLDVCNAHRFRALGEFVAGDVRVNGDDGDHLAAHLTDRGTHRGDFLGVPATGRAILTHELALYRLDAGRIAEVWVTVDNVRVLEQLRR